MKDRNITISEYLNVLQKEYIVAEIRYKIYPRPKDKIFYKNKVMNGKKRKIDDIGSRNNLPTIFNCFLTKDKMYQSIYNIKGLPLFSYKNDEHRKIQRPEDILFYYYKNSDVKIIIDNDIQIGKIIYSNFEKEICRVDVEGEIIDLPLNEVTRIL